MRSVLGRLIIISRPVAWPIGPVMVFAGMVWTGSNLTLVSIGQMLMMTFPLCLFAYGINDVYDYESDAVNNRRKNSIAGASADRSLDRVVQELSTIIVTAFMVISAMTGNLYNLALSGVLVLLAYAYSAPPIRLKTRPPLDSLVNGVMYVLIPFAVGYSYSGSLEGFPRDILWMVVCVMAVHAIASVLDFKADRDAGDKTIAVVLGRRLTIFLSAFIFLLTATFGDFSYPLIYVYLSLVGVFGILLSIHETLISRYLYLYFWGIYVLALIFVGIGLAQVIDRTH